MIPTVFYSTTGRLSLTTMGWITLEFTKTHVILKFNCDYGVGIISLISWDDKNGECCTSLKLAC